MCAAGLVSAHSGLQDRILLNYTSGFLVLLSQCAKHSSMHSMILRKLGEVRPSFVKFPTCGISNTLCALALPL